MLSRVYRPSHFARTERSDASLTVADWARLQDAVIAANFWALDPHGEAYGRDGACGTIEGRRKDIFHAVRRWSPDDQVHDLFDLAGLCEVRIY
jgi:hypothetical protein